MRILFPAYEPIPQSVGEHFLSTISGPDAGHLLPLILGILRRITAL